MSAVAWILAGALAAAVFLIVVLAFLLRRWRARARDTGALVADARRAIRGAAEEEAAIQAEQLRVATSRAHADALSSYVAEEHRLADRQRGELAVRERELSERMAETVTTVEQRVEERLRAWEADLERAQHGLEGAIAAMQQRLEGRIAEVQQKVEAEASELESTVDEQRAAAARLRETLETNAREALTQALEELQSQADDRRRAIDDLMDRLRQHEHSLSEQAERAESEARARVEATFAEFERRQVEGLERALTREIDRVSEAGAIEFDNRMRAIREEAAKRLREELDRTGETFLRRADGLIAAQLHEAVKEAAERLDERIVELARPQEPREAPDAE
ncbi:MAG TPA: hypothetical protein VLA22_08465 [Gaiellaceae bacterium]|nr:hypothetical protein [Gaiellaceae bacterium]